MNTVPQKTRTAKPASPIQRVGMLGVGIMGRAMAANLVKAGFAVSGYDPDPKAMKRLKAAGGALCSSAGDLAAGADVIICALPSPEALHDATQQIAAFGHRKLLVVETSTLVLPSRNSRITDSFASASNRPWTRPTVAGARRFFHFSNSAVAALSCNFSDSSMSG